MTTAIDEAAPVRVEPVSGRLVAAAAFVVPPLALLVVAFGLALRGGGVAAEQWQPAAAGLVASLLVFAAVGAVPAVPRAAWPMLACFAGLLAWSAASLLWSQSQEATAENVARLSLFAAVSTVGAAYGARPRAALSLAAGLALFGALAAALIELKLLTGSTGAFVGSRLSWPINYANADAALVWLPLAPLLAFAAAQPLRPSARGLFGFFAALALAVGLAAESRGGAIALTTALLAAVAIARDRGRFALTLLAVVGPVAFVAARMMAGDPSLSSATARSRGVAALIAAGAAGTLVCVLAMLDRRDRLPFRRREGWIALALWTVVLVLGAGAFVVKAGSPDSWLSARWQEFRSVNAVQTADVSHFASGTSNRYDYWRVAWRTFKAHPIDGVGSGAFSVPWFRLRSTNEDVTDAHSVEAGALAETGIIGLGLIGAVLILGLFGIRGARRGDGPWPIAAVALGGTVVYFVIHASVDWLPRLPALALPGFLALGVLATGGKSARMELARLPERVGVVVGALLVSFLVVPIYLSTRQTVRGEAQAATSTSGAVETLASAKRLNPFAIEPLIARATILQSQDSGSGALIAAEEAVRRAPYSWPAWIALTEARLAVGDRRGARAALGRAAKLNPLAQQLAALRQKL